MRQPKWRELKEAVRAVIFGPYTTKFPAEPAPAPEGYRGRCEYNEDDCIGCGACYQVCPTGAIQMVDDPVSRKRTFTYRPGDCVFCGLCHEHCSVETGINHTTEYELSTVGTQDGAPGSSIEHELVICEMCQAVISTRKHLAWVAKKIGAKKFANPTLLLVAEQDVRPEGLAEESSPRPPGPPDRADLMRILCPRCRRAVLVREIWG